MLQTSEFIEGIAEQCFNKLKTIDLRDPETTGEATGIIERYMLKLVVDLRIGNANPNT